MTDDVVSMPGDRLPPNSVAMTTKDLLLEVYHDMKFIRPAVQGLLDANLGARVAIIEADLAKRTASGLGPPLVTRVAALERYVSDEAVIGGERSRNADFSSKRLAAIILVANFLLGTSVVLANFLTAFHPT